MAGGSVNNTETPCVGRYGYVSAYDSKRGVARVQFPDKDNMVSGWLSVAAQSSKQNKDERHLDVGEHVYCNMLGNGLEAGVVLCSVFDDKNRPPLGNQDVQVTTFGDGTRVQYDRAAHALTIDCSASGGTVSIIAPDGVSIKGNVSIAGSLSVSGGSASISGNLHINGNVNATGSVIDSGGNTNHHSH